MTFREEAQQPTMRCANILDQKRSGHAPLLQPLGRGGWPRGGVRKCHFGRGRVL